MDGTTVSPPFTVMPVVQDGCRVLVLGGELDLAEAATLDAALDACTDGLPVVVVLGGLEFLDSSGIRVLFRQRKLGRPAAIVCSPGSHVARALDTVNMSKELPMFNDLSVAVKQVGSHG